MSRVEVPAEFRAIGYSGEFWLDIPPEDGVSLDELAALAPCLSPSPGWMVLQVDLENQVARFVRRDADAVMETFTRRRS